MHAGKQAIRVWLNEQGYASRIEDGQVVVLTKAKEKVIIKFKKDCSPMPEAIEFVIGVKHG